MKTYVTENTGYRKYIGDNKELLSAKQVAEVRRQPFPRSGLSFQSDDR